jgi:hypothetical protein
MTTIIHNVCRVTSAGSSEELAESHVNKTTRLAIEDSESPGENSDGASHKKCDRRRYNVLLTSSVLSTVAQ